jgi:hypothetical protein
MPHSGQCLCGDIKLQIASTHASQDSCHCKLLYNLILARLWLELNIGSDCKHISGSAFASNVIVKNEDLTVSPNRDGADDRLLEPQ